MSANPEKPKAELVGVLGAGPLFNEAEEAKRRKELDHYRRKGAWR